MHAIIFLLKKKNIKYIFPSRSLTVFYTLSSYIQYSTFFCPNLLKYNTFSKLIKKSIYSLLNKEIMIKYKEK